MNKFGINCCCGVAVSTSPLDRWGYITAADDIDQLSAAVLPLEPGTISIKLVSVPSVLAPYRKPHDGISTGGSPSDHTATDSDGNAVGELYELPDPSTGYFATNNFDPFWRKFFQYLIADATLDGVGLPGGTVFNTGYTDVNGICGVNAIREFERDGKPNCLFIGFDSLCRNLFNPGIQGAGMNIGAFSLFERGGSLIPSELDNPNYHSLFVGTSQDGVNGVGDARISVFHDHYTEQGSWDEDHSDPYFWLTQKLGGAYVSGTYHGAQSSGQFFKSRTAYTTWGVGEVYYVACSFANNYDRFSGASTQHEVKSTWQVYRYNILTRFALIGEDVSLRESYQFPYGHDPYILYNYGPQSPATHHAPYILAYSREERYMGCGRFRNPVEKYMCKFDLHQNYLRAESYDYYDNEDYSPKLGNRQLGMFKEDVIPNRVTRQTWDWGYTGSYPAGTLMEIPNDLPVFTGGPATANSVWFSNYLAWVNDGSAGSGPIDNNPSWTLMGAVGSLVMSTKETTPGEFLGDEWERVSSAPNGPLPQAVEFDLLSQYETGTVVTAPDFDYYNLEPRTYEQYSSTYYNNKVWGTANEVIAVPVQNDFDMQDAGWIVFGYPGDYILAVLPAGPGPLFVNEWQVGTPPPEVPLETISDFDPGTQYNPGQWAILANIPDYGSDEIFPPWSVARYDEDTLICCTRPQTIAGVTPEILEPLELNEANWCLLGEVGDPVECVIDHPSGAFRADHWMGWVTPAQRPVQIVLPNIDTHHDGTTNATYYYEYARKAHSHSRDRGEGEGSGNQIGRVGFYGGSYKRGEWAGCPYHHLAIHDPNANYPAWSYVIVGNPSAVDGSGYPTAIGYTNPLPVNQKAFSLGDWITLGTIANVKQGGPDRKSAGNRLRCIVDIAEGKSGYGLDGSEWINQTDPATVTVSPFDEAVGYERRKSNTTPPGFVYIPEVDEYSPNKTYPAGSTVMVTGATKKVYSNSRLVHAVVFAPNDWVRFGDVGGRLLVTEPAPPAQELSGFRANKWTEVHPYNSYAILNTGQPSRLSAGSTYDLYFNGNDVLPSPLDFPTLAIWRAYDGDIILMSMAEVAKVNKDGDVVWYFAPNTDNTVSYNLAVSKPFLFTNFANISGNKDWIHVLGWCRHPNEFDNWVDIGNATAGAFYEDGNYYSSDYSTDSRLLARQLNQTNFNWSISYDGQVVIAHRTELTPSDEENYSAFVNNRVYPMTGRDYTSRDSISVSYSEVLPFQGGIGNVYGLGSRVPRTNTINFCFDAIRPTPGGTPLPGFVTDPDPATQKEVNQY